MQVNKLVAAAALLSLLVWGVGASDEAIKIGIVDIDQAISSTEEGKAAREELARKQREFEGKLQPMLEAYKASEEDLKAKKFVLSDESLYQKQLDLVEQRNAIESKMKELEGQFKIDQKRLEGPLIAKLGGVIEELGKEQGFTLILRRGSPGVLYSREALDVTDVVIERYNKKKS